MKSLLGASLTGVCAGTLNGLFGAGGGMVLVPMLSCLSCLPQEQVFPASIYIILPVCLVCLAMAGPLPWVQALPYLLGSGIGGFLAGKWGQKIPVLWLHRGLGLLILWGGWRYLCGT
jgi:uncharacterized membrane protein YfcA